MDKTKHTGSKFLTTDAKPRQPYVTADSSLVRGNALTKVGDREAIRNQT